MNVEPKPSYDRIHGEVPWERVRMSYGDYFAQGFYGGLGFMAATALLWAGLFVLGIFIGVALA